jgi:putative exporter of polyketide antibiotics
VAHAYGTIHHEGRTAGGDDRGARFDLVLKSAVGFSVAALALFGVTRSLFGIAPSFAGSMLAATVGAVIGAFFVLKRGSRPLA